MHASVLVIGALLASLLADLGDDDRGVSQGRDSWRPWARDTGTVPGRPGRSGGNGGGSSYWDSCRSIPGANGITYVECTGGRPGGPDSAFEGVVPGDPAGAPAITPEMLLEQALRQLKPPLPEVQTAPPRGRDGLVGLPHFYWVDRARWHPITSRAEAGTVWAEVTATPTNLVIAPGTGQPGLTCQGPGVPYKKNQKSSCTHTYTRSSAGLANASYQATVSVVWSAVWAGSGGVGGPLAPLTVSTVFPVRIAEGQALIQRST